MRKSPSVRGILFAKEGAKPVEKSLSDRCHPGFVLLNVSFRGFCIHD